MTSEKTVALRCPVLTDGTAVVDLVNRCKPLDLNSHYFYLLQCSHFSETCCIAEVNGEIVGWASGFLHPKLPDVFFLWQVAVGPQARGSGVAAKMIKWLADKHSSSCSKIHTTITPSNETSWALFRSLEKNWGVSLSKHDGFDRDVHFGGRHETEVLVELPIPR